MRLEARVAETEGHTGVASMIANEVAQDAAAQNAMLQEEVAIARHHADPNPTYCQFNFSFLNHHQCELSLI